MPTSDPVPSPTSQQGSSPSAGQKRKRLPQASLACESCRARKAKCDQARPCSSCTRQGTRSNARTSPREPPAVATQFLDQELLQMLQALMPGLFVLAACYSFSLKVTFSSTLRGDQMNRPVLQSHVPPASQTHCQSKFITITASPTPNVTTVPGGAQLTSTVSNLVTSSASSVIGVQEIIEQPNQPARLGSIISNTLSEAEADGFGELNTHTQGTEFYGPTGIFSFLLRLRARARSQNGQSIDRISSGLSNGRKSQDLSIVNLLHSSDYPVSVIDAHKIRSPIPSQLQRHFSNGQKRVLETFSRVARLKAPKRFFLCGMAARTALAIGIPNCAKPESVQANILWW
ncbi:hypothetical protein AOQ84DRAFT_404582 [Glonium stellatum]|uniref:Zn(2)-C6 fungal-type domain-containing protein n=1 Tax=Glonium stellatum TaxID=574774 RepID=A0A8E2F3I9_9PEZI|nr:hypothetical protein AOQ84DRAFT_404582 [Glonium stellatum]